MPLPFRSQDGSISKKVDMIYTSFCVLPAFRASSSGAERTHTRPHWSPASAWGLEPPWPARTPPPSPSALSAAPYPGAQTRLRRLHLPLQWCLGWGETDKWRGRANEEVREQNAKQQWETKRMVLTFWFSLAAFTWTLLIRIEVEEQLNRNKKWSCIRLSRNTILWSEYNSMRNRRGGVVRYNRHVYTYSDWFGEGAGNLERWHQQLQ